MAHPAQKQFFTSVKEKYPQYFKEVKVIDLGSLDVNGSLKELFSDSEYIGIDIVSGKNVDIVCKADEAPFPDAIFDVVISAEMLEHDEFWKESLLKMYNLAKPNALIAISCAGEGRPEHGTTRTGAEWGTSSDYYMNITPDNIRSIYGELEWKEVYYKNNNESHDTYFYGIK